VHEEKYIQRFEAACESPGLTFLDNPDTVVCSHSYRAARQAVDGLLTLLESTIVQPAGRGFAALRPPGHHAEKGLAMGFCLLNNIAIAATHFSDRVAIVDFDVHHGRGTQHIFYENPDVFYASTHQWPHYPGTGAANERGHALALGTTLNLPLPASSDGEFMRKAASTSLIPALHAFPFELLLVSAGFDAHRADPLSDLLWEEEDYFWWGKELSKLAKQRPIVAALEGGYDLRALPQSVEAFLKGLEAE